ncbi:MAG: SPASM domain-containing protein, partial [Mailhella sp.]
EGQISPCVYLNVPFTSEQKNRTVFGLTANDNPLDIWKKTEYALFRSAVQSSIPPKACASCAKRYEEPCVQ